MKKINVGFVNIYNWRPFVDHMVYLSEAFDKEKYTLNFLQCGGGMPSCYNQKLRSLPRWVECFNCKLKAFHSYGISKNKISIIQQTKNTESIPDKLIKSSFLSSISSLERREHSPNIDLVGKEIDLSIFLKSVYEEAFNWIIKKKINYLFIFNGRMDATNTIITVAEELNINFSTIEASPFFGSGIKVLPNENCLGLKNIYKFNNYWKNKNLTKKQCKKAHNLIYKNIKQFSNLEWRTYNKNSVDYKWKSASKNKVLILPSSLYEFAGHKDWSCSWGNQFDGYDNIIKYFNVKSSEILVRFHPGWAENIGKNIIDDFNQKNFTKWCNENKYKFIPSKSNASSISLIKQADLIIVTNSSAALQAAFFGKKIISIINNPYYNSGFVFKAATKNDLIKIPKNIFDIKNKTADTMNIKKKLLRFVYSMSYRLPFASNTIHGLDAQNYIYKKITQNEKFKINMLVKENNLISSDKNYHNNSEYEDNFIKNNFDSYNYRKRKIIGFRRLNKGLIKNGFFFLRNKFLPGDRIK